MKLIINIEKGVITGAYGDGLIDLTIVETDRNVDGGRPGITVPEVKKLEEFEMPTWFCNHYACAKCGHHWSNEWSSTCDDDCPSCGARHWSPTHSDDLTPSINLS